MRNDLLEAQAAVDWPVSNLPFLNERIETWLATNVEVRVEEGPPPATHDSVVAIEKEPFPLAFNVEAGAHINVIRSSLDILATALAYRFNIPKPDAVSFPIASSADGFNSGKYKGSGFLSQLPPAERPENRDLQLNLTLGVKDDDGRSLRGLV